MSGSDVCCLGFHFQDHWNSDPQQVYSQQPCFFSCVGDCQAPWCQDCGPSLNPYTQKPQTDAGETKLLFIILALCFAANIYVYKWSFCRENQVANNFEMSKRNFAEGQMRKQRKWKVCWFTQVCFVNTLNGLYVTDSGNTIDEDMMLNLLCASLSLA